MDRPELQEQLDVCRSVAEAAGDPQLRALAGALAKDTEIIAQFEDRLATDRMIVERLHAVDSPTDLRERLTAAFREGVERSAQDRSRMPEIAQRALESPSEESGSPSTIAPVRKNLVTRRRYFGKVLALATVTCVSLALVFFLIPRPTSMEETLTEADFAEKAISLCIANNEPWHPASSPTQPTLPWKPSELPLISQVNATRWKEVYFNAAGKCEIWELSTPHGAQAYLLLTSAPWKAGMLPSAVSRTPSHSSGNWSAGAWRQNGIAYALVVEGDAKAYRDMIRVQPIAQLMRRSVR
jgi:hypothetical protein